MLGAVLFYCLTKHCLKQCNVQIGKNLKRKRLVEEISDCLTGGRLRSADSDLVFQLDSAQSFPNCQGRALSNVLERKGE